MRVSEVMHSPAVTCWPSTTAEEAARLMRDRDVGSVLVLDGVGYLAGIVTDRDLAVRGVALGRPTGTTVEELMTREVATIPVHADVAEAATTMAARGVRRLPVVDPQGTPHGVLALDDLLRQVHVTTGSLAATVVLQTAGLATH